MMGRGDSGSAGPCTGPGPLSRQTNTQQEDNGGNVAMPTPMAFERDFPGSPGPESASGPSGPSAVEEEEERKAMQNILRAFRTYAVEGELDVLRWERSFNKLSSQHGKILGHLPGKYQTIRECLRRNQAFLDLIVSTVGLPIPPAPAPPHSSSSSSSAQEGSTGTQRVSAMDVEKVRYVLRDLVREWSAEGSIERSQSFDKITKLLSECFPREKIDPKNRPRVLIPGCGLGRLVLEVAGRGFQVEGNEFSYYMLFTSAFMMNYATKKDQWRIYPWSLTSCNNIKDEDQQRPVTIPDVYSDSFDIEPNQMSICAGDFTDVYSRPEHKEKWDCVITSWFMDTSRNPIDYIEVISHCLKKGGVWINLGPLLWHWADSHTYLGEEEMSLELSMQDIDKISTLYGFDIKMQEMVKCNYATNIKSMMQTQFYCNFSKRVKVR